MKNVTILFLVLLGMQIHAQRVIQPKLVELDLKGIVYKKEFSFDFKLHESGWALAYNNGEIVSYERTKYYQLELGTMKDPREKKQSKLFNFNPFVNGNAFIFGKVNSVMNVRGSIGFKRYLSEKAKKKGLAVGYSYAFGPSIALVKPYYLLLIYRQSETEGATEDYRHEKYSEANAEKFLNDNDIVGSSSFFRGFGEMSVVPGIQGKFATHFALGAFDKYVKAIEVGIMADLYIKKIPIMLETEEIKNRPYFIKLFVLGQFGLRKN